MGKQSLTSAQVERALAAIEKGHQIEGKQPSASALDRARRVLTGELSPEDARLEMDAAIRAIADRETGAGAGAEGQ